MSQSVTLPIEETLSRHQLGILSRSLNNIVLFKLVSLARATSASPSEINKKADDTDEWRDDYSHYPFWE